MGGAAQVMETVNTVAGVSTKGIAEQTLYFGGYSDVLNTSSNACYTFVDDQNNDWSSYAADYMCKDAHHLPDTPATCYLNYGDDLDVSLGTLERSTISTKPMLGAVGNVKKDISVLCTRDAGITVSTSFNFTPIIVNGDEVISTTTPNLGVAIFYEGKLIGPSTPPITENYVQGYSYRSFEFQAVRDPNAVLKDISTGDFTASAIVVMTEQ